MCYDIGMNCIFVDFIDMQTPANYSQTEQSPKSFILSLWAIRHCISVQRCLVVSKLSCLCDRKRSVNSPVGNPRTGMTADLYDLKNNPNQCQT